MILLPTKNNTIPTPPPIKNINTEWHLEAFEYFFYVYSKEASPQSNANTNVSIRVKAHRDVTEIYEILRKPLYEKNMFMNNQVLDDRRQEVIGFIRNGHPIFTLKKPIQHKINKGIEFLIENKIDSDILDRLLITESSTKLKPRVVISKGRVPSGAKSWSSNTYVTITCLVGYKDTVSQMLLQLADPKDFPTPILPPPLQICSNALQWQETGHNNSYLSLLNQTGIDISNMAAVTVKSFSKDLIISEINISLALGLVSRSIYRIHQDSGIIRIERSNETEREGKFYLICQRDRVDLI